MSSILLSSRSNRLRRFHRRKIFWKSWCTTVVYSCKNVEASGGNAHLHEKNNCCESTAVDNMGVDQIPLLEKCGENESALDGIDICIPSAYEPETTHVAGNTPMPQPSAPEFVPVPRGNPTSSSILCANCKSPLAPNHKFCSECGEPSHSEGPSNTPPLNYAETVQSSTFSVQIPVGVQDGQTLKVHVPPGYPQCGQTVYFSVPAGVSPGQTVQVPLPSKSGSIEYFQARVPQSCLPGQVMQVRVPQGYRNAGELVHFTIPSGTGPNQVVKVPLPAAPSQPTTGKFKVCLPLNCSPGQRLKVQVPAGYPQSGQDVIFLVPQGATPGSVVLVPLPALKKPGVYD